MNLDEFNKLKEKVSKFVEINDLNVSDRILNWAKNYSQILNHFVQETKNLADLKTDLDEIYGKIVQDMKENRNYTYSKSETESYILADPEYKSQKLKVNHQEMMVNYLENLLGMVKNLQYNLKTYIDLKMFLGGK